MKVTVEHEIANDPVYCWDGDSGGYYNGCIYEKRRDRRWKDGKVIRNEKNLPKCTLFNEWLERGGIHNHTKKCDKCLLAMEQAKMIAYSK